MSLTRTVARGTSRLLAGAVVAKVLDFALVLMLARGLGVDAFGRVMYAFSFTLLFNVLADLGVTTVVTRELARTPARRRQLLADAVRVKLGLAVVTGLAGIGAFVATGASPEQLWMCGVFLLAVLGNSTALMLSAVLKAEGRPERAGLALVAKGVIGLGSGVLGLQLGWGALGGALAYLAAAGGHLAATIALTRHAWHAAGDGEPALDTPARRAARVEMLREALPLAFSSMFIALYFRVDTVLLGMIENARAVGLYGGIYRFLEAFTLFGATYHAVVFPYMARAADGPAGALGVLCRKSFRTHLLVSMGLAVFVSFQARPLVVLVLGPAYAASATALAVLIWAVPASLMASTLFHLLAAQRRQSSATWAVAITAAFNVAANLIVIPRWSYLGAAAVTVASEALCFVLLLRAFRVGMPAMGLGRMAWRPIAAGLGLAALLGWSHRSLPGETWGFVAVGIAAIGVYAVLLVAVRAVGREDWELLGTLIPSALKRHRAPGPAAGN